MNYCAVSAIDTNGDFETSGIKIAKRRETLERISVDISVIFKAISALVSFRVISLVSLKLI
jgi:hypothetical protein